MHHIMNPIREKVFGKDLVIGCLFHVIRERLVTHGSKSIASRGCSIENVMKDLHKSGHKMWWRS